MARSTLQIEPDRVREVKSGEGGSGPVIYWMNRDQRAEDNWALLFAQKRAVDRRVPLAVVFSVSDPPQDRSARQTGFMIEGLIEVKEKLEKLNIPMVLVSGSVPKTVAHFTRSHKASELITDFSPLRVHTEWRAKVATQVAVPFIEVDAHNVVPCRAASPKAEYAAYTIRPKLRKLLPRFLTEFPRLRKHPFAWKEKTGGSQWNRILTDMRSDTSRQETAWIKPGGKAGRRVLREFLKKRLCLYDELRNDPTKPGQSDLSPYLHFGQISAQRVALEAERYTENYGARDAFLEELIVRRELSDNFCLNCDSYDLPDGFPDWAQITLENHRLDPRPYLYTVDQFENAQTHDDLWNAAQLEMVMRGKMHGYMRMYWAKKILEWSPTPRDAMHAAIYLNDKYEMDGHDPNGYTGVAWSIGGVHDRPWPEREIFGKVRYMSYDGCRRKFDVRGYVDAMRKLRYGRTS